MIKKISLQKFDINRKNSLKWSNYKHRVFNECKRKFLYKYAESLINPNEKKEVEELKNLKTIKNWLGETIHRYIDIFINTESLQDTLLKFSNEFSNTIKNSRKTIFEFYYSIPISNSQIKEIYNISTVVLKNFIFYYNQNIKLKKDKIIARDSDGIQSLFLDNITVLYKPDLVVKEYDSITIFDWKTLDGEIDSKQVNLYILAYKTLGFEKIKFVATNLYPSIKQTEFYLEYDKIQDYREFVKNSFYEIKNFWDELEIFTKQEFENLFEEIYKKFPKTTNISLCNKCEFRKLCFN